MNDQLQVDLLEVYGELSKDNAALKSIHSKFAYYLADDLNVGVKSASPIYYYDIKSAFPSILHMILDRAEYSEFLDTFDSITDKRKKLIYISTNADNIRPGLLRELNSWAKVVIFTKVYNDFNNIQVLEYKKDGVLFKGTERATGKYSIVDTIFDGSFNFHIENDFSYYFRFDKTSIYVRENGDVEVKGKYKAMPQFIVQNIIPNIELITSDPKVQTTILNIYSINYYLTLVKFGKHDEISNYYGFGTKFLSIYNSTLEYGHSTHSPIAVLLKVIYPIIALFKSR